MRGLNRWYANVTGHFDPTRFNKTPGTFPMRPHFSIVGRFYEPQVHSARSVELTITDPDYADELREALKQWAKARRKDIKKAGNAA